MKKKSLECKTKIVLRQKSLWKFNFVKTNNLLKSKFNISLIYLFDFDFMFKQLIVKHFFMSMVLLDASVFLSIETHYMA